MTDLQTRQIADAWGVDFAQVVTLSAFHHREEHD